MSEKVKVRLQCEQTVRYDRVIEMSHEEFDRLDKLLDGDRQDRRRALVSIDAMIRRGEGYCDESDIKLDTFQLETSN